MHNIDALCSRLAPNRTYLAGKQGSQLQLLGPLLLHCVCCAAAAQVQQPNRAGTAWRLQQHHIAGRQVAMQEPRIVDGAQRSLCCSAVFLSCFALLQALAKYPAKRNCALRLPST